MWNDAVNGMVSKIKYIFNKNLKNYSCLIFLFPDGDTVAFATSVLSVVDAVAPVFPAGLCFSFLLIWYSTISLHINIKKNTWNRKPCLKFGTSKKYLFFIKSDWLTKEQILIC